MVCLIKQIIMVSPSLAIEQKQMEPMAWDLTVEETVSHGHLAY
jgi:hypothetical protein